MLILKGSEWFDTSNFLITEFDNNCTNYYGCWYMTTGKEIGRKVERVLRVLVEDLIP